MIKQSVNLFTVFVLFAALTGCSAIHTNVKHKTDASGTVLGQSPFSSGAVSSPMMQGNFSSPAAAPIATAAAHLPAPSVPLGQLGASAPVLSPSFGQVQEDPWANIVAGNSNAGNNNASNNAGNNIGNNNFGGADFGSNAVSLDKAAKEEEERRLKFEKEQEKTRAEALAAASQTKPYLQPLPKWNGPFDDPDSKQTTEQDIIRQAGHVEINSKQFDNTPVFDWEKENEKGFDWSVLDPVSFFTKVRDWMGMGPDEKKANAAMKKGRELLLQTPDLKDEKKVLEAAKQFKEAARRSPDSVIEEDALHLAAECYFFSDKYASALTIYQKLIIKYQHSKYVDSAVHRLFKIGRYWEEEDRRGVSSVNLTDETRPTFDTFGYCKKAYETIFINDPNGPVSDDAVMALASAFLAKGRYQGDVCFEKAAYYYQYLRENYPLSKNIANEHYYELLPAHVLIWVLITIVKRLMKQENLPM
jgi:tetratricopeptide (TPR) repeat protein